MSTNHSRQRQRVASIEAQAAIAAFMDDFRQHGSGVIERMRQEHPADYMRLAASLAPDETQALAPFSADELTDDELRAIIWRGLARDGIGLGNNVRDWRAATA